MTTFSDEAPAMASATAGAMAPRVALTRFLCGEHGEFPDSAALVAHVMAGRGRAFEQGCPAHRPGPCVRTS